MYKKNNEIADKETLKLRRAALVTNMVTAFVMPFMGNSLNLAIPAIGAEFGANASAVGWMVTAYILTVAALSVPFGRLADVGIKKDSYGYGHDYIHHLLCCLGICILNRYSYCISRSSGDWCIYGSQFQYADSDKCVSG